MDVTGKPKIVLVSMPFAAVASPSIGLTQLKAVVEEEWPGRFDISILYLNHDFHRFLDDAGFYGQVMSNAGFATGLGDWLFRQAAFPETEDNSAAYLDAYYPDHDESCREIRAAVWKIRPRLEMFIDQVIADHELASADLVGFSSIFSQTVPSLALARALKELQPAITTVIGGAACAGGAGIEFAGCFEAIDHVFSGPALVSFPEYLGCWADGDRVACDSIDGVFSKGDEPREASRFGPERDINQVVPLDYGSFLDSFEQSFAGTGLEPRLLFETSRGCWWGEKSHCSFCGLNGPFMCYHAMNAEMALERIHAVLRYADRCKFFASTDNILPESYVTDVMPRLRVPDGAEIQYEVRANLSEAEIAALVAAGVKVIQPGIEALSSETLRLMRKGTSAFGNIRFLKACGKHPVFVGYSLLIFSPGEREETYERYLDIIPLLTHLPPPLAVYPIEFVRYSPYFDHAAQHGLDLEPEPFYALTYPVGDGSVGRIAGKFRDRHADMAAIGDWVRRLNEGVAYWQSRWYKRDGRAQSRLCLSTDGTETCVYDSRSGEELEYPLSPAQIAVLEALEAPHSASGLAGKLGPGIDVSTEIGFLTERGLLFEEGGRYLSLVID